MQPTIYIPNYNGSDRLGLLLESLAGQTQPFRTVVVDNGSEDDSVAMMQNRFPGIGMVELDHNVGFGRALNQAINAHGGDPLILLNNDVQCEPDFVDAMLDALGPGIDMVAGVLVSELAPDLVDTAGIVADHRTLMAFDYLNGHSVDSISGAPPPLAPSGGAALYRRDAFESVGGFDERIFAYYEDFDLGLRLRLAGAGCALAHGARGRHGYSSTLAHDPGAKYALTGWSRGYMLRRYGVMKHPGGAARTIASETAVCLGQVVLDGTFRGISGRFRGWRDGGEFPGRKVPDGLIEVQLRASLSRRLRRHPKPRAARTIHSDRSQRG
jgi:N-acetylglucosaminyl-diphospho-decaprenol L-rhamnosyltransferase